MFVLFFGWCSFGYFGLVDFDLWVLAGRFGVSVFGIDFVRWLFWVGLIN